MTHAIEPLIDYLYKGRKRKNGEPYARHSYAVRDILAEQGVNDPTVLAAALLHDVLEDTYISREYLVLRFGRKIARIVHLLSKNPAWHTGYCRMKSNIDEMELLWRRYPETVLIKIADRLHNIRTIKGFSAAKQQEYLAETEHMLLPFFRRIAAESPRWKPELRSLCSVLEAAVRPESSSV